MSSASFDLIEFLSQQKSDGQFDSRGSFTIAVRRASEKLAKFSLPYDEAWVPKLLQAAVGWRAGGLTLTQTRDASSFHLRPSKRYGVPRKEEILEAFLSGDLSQAEPLSRFCLAIKALGEQANFPFLLVIDDGTEPHVTDSNFLCGRPLRAEHRHLGGIALTVSHHKVGESKLFASLRPVKAAKRSYAIVKELYNQGPYCPLPMRHDGRPVNDWCPNRMHSEHNVACQPLLTRALSVQRRRQRPWLRPNDFPQAIWAQHSGSQSIRIAGSNDDECDVLLRLWLGAGAGALPASTLYWVADGVVVKRTGLGFHGELRLEVLADASELPLDLTGLSLAESALAKASQAGVLTAVKLELERTAPECVKQAPHAAPAFHALRASLVGF